MGEEHALAQVREAVGLGEFEPACIRPGQIASRPFPFRGTVKDAHHVALLHADRQHAVEGVGCGAETLEDVCIKSVEKGNMTKDLAILIGPATEYLTTNQFLETIKSRLEKKLN